MAEGGTRSPTSHRTPGQMKKMSRGYNATPEQISNRSQRNQARDYMKKKVGAAAIAGKDVHHKKPIRHGGGNGSGNLGVASVSKNRGWEKK
jgi:hypothetical protein